MYFYQSSHNSGGEIHRNSSLIQSQRSKAKQINYENTRGQKCLHKGKMFITAGFCKRANDSPLSPWNFLHVFTATNISSLFTGSPFDTNRRHESKRDEAHTHHIIKPGSLNAAKWLKFSFQATLNVQVISGSSYLQSEIRTGFFSPFIWFKAICPSDCLLFSF